MQHERGHRLTTLVLLDQRLAALGNGLALGEVEGWFSDTATDVVVRCVADPGYRMAALGRALAESGAGRLVLGLCTPQYAVGEVPAQARLAGLDPLGIETVDLGTHAALVHPPAEATEKAKLLLAAAVARARAFPGSRPEMVKPHLPAQAGRRFLFGLGHLEYRPVPWIEHERCVAETGCRLCVEACPADALTAVTGAIRLNAVACVSCGLCLAACPGDAVLFGGHASAQLQAQLAALLDPQLVSLAPRGILFYCAQTAATLAALARDGWSYPAGWLPVRLPCVGMLSPTQLLGCLQAGAASVAVISCGETCPCGQQEAIEGRVSFCRALLRRLGDSNSRVLSCPASQPQLDAQLRVLPQPVAASPAATRQPLVSPNGKFPITNDRHQEAAGVLLALAQAYGSSEQVALPHPSSPFGVIEVSPGCTLCGVCSEVCPAHALAQEHRDDRVSLTFDAARCTACGQCVPRCSEAARGVLRLHRVTDLRRLAQGRVTLYQDRTRRCAACGGPLAPEAMLQRIGAMLGSEDTAAWELISRYCPSCRGVTPVPSPAAPQEGPPQGEGTVTMAETA